MNGNRFVLDTNAIVALLQGNSDILIHTEIAEWIGISIISYNEFLSFPDISDEDISLLTCNQGCRKGQFLQIDDL